MRTPGPLGTSWATSPSAAGDAVARLAALTGRPVALLNGDNAPAAARLAEQVGTGDVRADLLPADGVEAVRDLHARHGHVTVVGDGDGDGDGDAPMLAAAGTGAAMGRHGSNLALQSADLVLVRDDLAALPAVIDLSRRPAGWSPRTSSSPPSSSRPSSWSTSPAAAPADAPARCPGVGRRGRPPAAG